MLSSLELLALLIIVVSFIPSYLGFKDTAFYERYALDADRIHGEKEFFRIVSSGFLHNSWIHLILNLLFLLVGAYLANGLTVKSFIVVYVVSLVVANIYVIYYNKKRPVEMVASSTAAVSGIVCVSILSVPGEFTLPYIHFSIPVWSIGALYLILTSFSLSPRSEGVNFQLAIMGALSGLLAVLMSEPKLVRENLMVYVGGAVILPLVLMLGRRNPKFFSLNWGRGKENEEEAESFLDDESELNNLLEKVNTKGIDSLSRKERKKLEELSKKI